MASMSTDDGLWVTDELDFSALQELSVTTEEIIGSEEILGMNTTPDMDTTESEIVMFTDEDDFEDEFTTVALDDDDVDNNEVVEDDVPLEFDENTKSTSSASTEKANENMVTGELDHTTIKNDAGTNPLEEEVSVNTTTTEGDDRVQHTTSASLKGLLTYINQNNLTPVATEYEWKIPSKLSISLSNSSDAPTGMPMDRSSVISTTQLAVNTTSDFTE